MRNDPGIPTWPTGRQCPKTACFRSRVDAEKIIDRFIAGKP